MALRVLIVDDMAIIRQPMAMALKNTGYEVREASDGIAALDLLRQDIADVVVLDVSMPRMDGITMLRHLRTMPGGACVHVILLTGMGDRDTVLKAAALGVRDYMLKSAFSIKELLARVQRHGAGAAGQSVTAPPPGAATASTDSPGPPSPAKTASPSAPDAGDSSGQHKLILLTRDQTRARLEKIIGTRTCAGVVAQVMALASSPRSEIADLVRVIETDPILASRVLQLANSSMFRQKAGRLANIDDAVRNVGMRSIQSLVISIGVFESFPPDQSDGFNTLRCWQHSFAVSAILRVLMAQRTEDEREHMALVGLFHDLGEIVLRQFFASEFEQIINHARQTGQPSAVVEAVALSMRHSELVNDVLTRIGLPASVAIPIMRFHEGSADTPAESLQEVRLLQIANSIAHGMMLAPSSEALLAPISRADLKRACGNDRVDIDLKGLRNEVLTATNVLARLPSADEARFMQPLIGRKRTVVWYARHAGYADLDPVAAALDMLGRVRVEGRLPQSSAELEYADIIMAVSPFAESPPVMLQALQALRHGNGYRGQPIIALLGNTGGVATNPNVSLLPLPVSLHALADQLARAANRQTALVA